MSVVQRVSRAAAVAGLAVFLTTVTETPVLPCYEEPLSEGSSPAPIDAQEASIVPIVQPSAPGAYVRDRRSSIDLPANPFVAGLLTQVSKDSIAAHVTKLVGFYTRHTNSDTTSATRGIGACRNWIRARFQGYAATSPGDMTASFFQFDTTACAQLRHHKNTFAKKTGAVSPSRNFIVTGHMDSRMEQNCSDTAFAPGANDDGSGVAVIMEMARVLAPHPLDASLIMMSVTGEEQGLLGSTAYAKFAVSSGMRIDGMATNDIVGNITGCEDPACPPGEPVITDSLSVRTFSRNPSTSSGRQMTRAVRLVARRYMSDFFVKLIPMLDRPGRSGDHVPFSNRGFTAMRFTEPYEFGNGTGTTGHQHNQTDLIPFMNFGYVVRASQINLAAFASFALAPESPAQPIVENIGGGNLRVTWPSVTTAPDLAGYRVALRAASEDSLFYFDIRDAGKDAGLTQEFILTGLTPDAPLYVSISAYDMDLNESIFGPETPATPVVAVPGADAGLALRLLSPNPTTGPTEIGFVLPRAGNVDLEVLDAAGRLVRRLVAHKAAPAGETRVSWDGRSEAGTAAGSGIFFFRLAVGRQVRATIKVIRVL